MSKWLLFTLLGLVWCPLPVIHALTLVKFSCQSKQLKKSATTMKWLYYLTLVVLIVDMYFICYTITVEWILHAFQSNVFGFYLIAVIGITIAIALVAIIHIIRAKTSFENTIYQLTPCELILPILFTIVQVILFLIRLFIDISNHAMGKNQDSDMTNQLVFYGIGVISLEIAYVCICIIFAKKLLQIIVDQPQSIKFNNNNNNNNNNNTIELDDKQVLLAEVATKQTVLSMMSTLGSIIAALTMIIVGDHQITYLFVTIGIVIAAITLWFSFGFADSQYHYYCNICHKNCKKKSQQIIINRIGSKKSLPTQ